MILCVRLSCSHMISSDAGDKVHTALAFSMNTEFSAVLKKQMIFFNSPSADSFTDVNSKIDDVKNVMYQNIENILHRGLVHFH